jgi:hypothetical protein
MKKILFCEAVFFIIGIMWLWDAVEIEKKHKIPKKSISEVMG